MKPIDFTEKVILILELAVEVLVILILVCMFSSCRVKKQVQSKQSKQSEVSFDVKTSETASNFSGSVFYSIELSEIDRDILANLAFFRFSAPDSLGNQYLTGAAIVDYKDRSKIRNTSEVVDSASNRTDSSKTVADNSKVKLDTKQELKTKNERESRGWTGVVIVIVLTALAGFTVLIFNRK